MEDKIVSDIFEVLKRESSDKYKENVVKMGIPSGDALGVPTPKLRKIVTSIPKKDRSKMLALEFWKTGVHEAKMLAVLIAGYHYNDYSDEEVWQMFEDICSWDLCDLFCKSVLIKRKDSELLIREFLSSDKLYIKRAGFTLLASMSTHSTLSENEIEGYLELVPVYSDDDRLHVKKAASWALRELGKISEASKDYAITVAEKMKESSSSAHQWLAKDALKELPLLVRVEGRSRLISSKSKMGQEAEGKSS